MRAPSKRKESQMVKIHRTQSLAGRVELNFAFEEVTNQVKPKERMNQAVMQMNGLSPVNFNVTEADVFHSYRKQNWRSRNWLGSFGSVGVLDNGMIQDGFNVNLGDPSCSFFAKGEYAKTSRKRRGLANDAEEVGSIGSTPSPGKPDTWGSDRQNGNCFSNGVAASQRVA